MSVTFLMGNEIKSRIFNGKEYTTYRYYAADKRAADRDAIKSREAGWLARVVMEKHGLNRRYFIYIRKKE